jgi:hypothetical protein
MFLTFIYASSSLRLQKTGFAQIQWHTLALFLDETRLNKTWNLQETIDPGFDQGTRLAPHGHILHSRNGTLSHLDMGQQHIYIIIYTCLYIVLPVYIYVVLSLLVKHPTLKWSFPIPSVPLRFQGMETPPAMSLWPTVGHRDNVMDV